jgi:hypothetical protein
LVFGIFVIFKLELVTVSTEQRMSMSSFSFKTRDLGHWLGFPPPRRGPAVQAKVHSLGVWQLRDHLQIAILVNVAGWRYRNISVRMEVRIGFLA